ncbi:hypothetical protein [Sphingopyxis sp.]|uniref:hypothetical protein n=1 Tax=Sphingopyxis sp. TaxID=1908224 RepID=UPI003D114DD2
MSGKIAVMLLVAALGDLPPAPDDAAIADPAPLLGGAVIECSDADLSRKTCSALATFTPDASGELVNINRTLIDAAAPDLVLTTRFAIHRRGQMLCFRVDDASLASPRFEARGRLVDSDATRKRQAQFQTMLRPYLGQQICETYVRDGGAIRVEAWVGENRMRDLDRNVVWVTPGDGYILRP